MRYAVGIDLGTTFTCAAVGDAAGTRMVPLSPDITVPSLAYHAPDGTLLTGAAAQQAAADPARLGRGFKRRLGDPTPLMLGGAAYSPTALMAAQLRAVLDQVSGAMGGPPASVVLTCPAVWGPYRREQFAEVPRLAGVDHFRLITEPEAAATHYSRERTLGDGEVVAVYDLGGGTLDTTVLRMRAGDLEILGTPEGIEHLGGMDFDDALLAHLDERLGGAITALDPATLARVRALCVQAKIDLSTEPDVTLAVPLPAGEQEVTVTRRDFNEVIKPSVELTLGALRRTVTSAGLTGEDLSAVLLAGGSSRVPLVTQQVFEEFDKPVRVAQHPKFTVALGAATVATRALDEPTPPVVSAPPVTPTPRRPGRRRWLVPTAAAAIALVAALVIALVAFNSRPDVAAANSTDTTEPAPAGAAPEPLSILADAPIPPYRAFIASADNWGGTEIVGDTGSHSVITATVDSGLRVHWLGGADAQIYLQTVNDQRDLSSYVDSDAALVFDVTVHSTKGAGVTLAAHCGYPCGAELDATNLFRDLPVGQEQKVSIPLSCFTDKGLNESNVDTPFLVFTQGPLDVTFKNIAWVPDGANATDITACDQLA